ncbi:MAG TPA: hypothetical protein VK611_08300 [Acidimicrobiales bacterium]|nr:hypothetical protein [Acidimicrobiales bacterium]
MFLREIACARAGDKGDVSNVVVVPHDPGAYPFLVEHLTADRVRGHFGELVRGEVTRYEMPGISALNFVMQGALGGGVTRSIWMDTHGKSRASLMLTLELDRPPAAGET